jgi:ethanolamine permease
MTRAADRTLPKTVGTFQLWGIAVGLVISGEYFGWSYGWASAGTLGFLVTSAFVALMYATFIFSFTELTTGDPARRRAVRVQPARVRATGGYLAGFRDADRVPVRAAGDRAGDRRLRQRPVPALEPRWVACAAYIVFMALNIAGMTIAASFELVVTLVADLRAAASSWASSRPGSRAPNFVKGGWAARHVQQRRRGRASSPRSRSRSGSSSPSRASRWRPRKPRIRTRSVPIAYIGGILTLVALALGVMVFAGGSGDWTKLANINDPLPQAMKIVVGATAAGCTCWSGSACSGSSPRSTDHHRLLAPDLRALARRLPAAVLGRIHPRLGTPHVAILAGGAVGIAAIFSDELVKFGGQSLTANIVTMSVFGAIVMYILSMASLFKLRRSEPQLARPFRAPAYPLFPRSRSSPR